MVTIFTIKTVCDLGRSSYFKPAWWGISRHLLEMEASSGSAQLHLHCRPSQGGPRGGEFAQQRAELSSDYRTGKEWEMGEQHGQECGAGEGSGWCREARLLAGLSRGLFGTAEYHGLGPMLSREGLEYHTICFSMSN